MEKNSNSQKKVSKRLATVSIQIGVILLGILLVVFFHPQGKLAALLPDLKSVYKFAVGQDEQEKPTIQLKEEQSVNNAKKDNTDASKKTAESSFVDEVGNDGGGRDLSNDPKYQEELKKIYSEDDLKRLSAPRKWVTMPFVEGMTEADAVRTMQSIGITPRVAYEDRGKKEGTCTHQEIPAGMKWNTDAAVFIYIQRSEKTIEPVPAKAPAPVNTPAEPTPTLPETNNPVESLKPDEINSTANDSSNSSQTAEPIGQNLNQP